MPPDYRTRFAPSPTGALHLGHAFSALTAEARARAAAGQFLLRIENTDTARCRPALEAAMLADLRWLGLDWPEPVLRQSDHLPRYGAALARLTDRGLTYNCRCSRSDIHAALSAPQEGVTHLAPDGAIYPGTCRGVGLPADVGHAVRLDLGRALNALGPAQLEFHETGPEAAGIHQTDLTDLRRMVGDVVLARRDIGTAAYHLAVVVDDAAQGITEVVRGMDLFAATPIHRLLQALLGLPTPTYHHHRLIRDDQGKRLAKRDNARSLASLRSEGATPQDIRAIVGL